MKTAFEPHGITYHGNCLDLMVSIKDQSIDMILCDLPYGTTNNKWDSIIPLQPLWKQYGRIIKPSGTIVLTGHQIFTAKLIMSNERLYKYKIVWVKSKATNFLNAKKQPLRKHEDICIFSNGQTTYNPQMFKGMPYDKGIRKESDVGSYNKFAKVQHKSEGSRYPSDVVYFKTPESEGDVIHPTQKPVALFEYLIKTYTNENQTVLDNCSGSGTTAIACINTNRHFILMEKNEDYYNKANERIQATIKNKSRELF